MAKLRLTGSIKLKVVVEKLQRSRFLNRKPVYYNHDEFEDFCDSTNVPDDVKEGHFAVMAMDDGGLKRFIVPIGVLSHPWFVRLLEQAAEEYGFDRKGALTVPCRPNELEMILRQGSTNGTLVNSC